jgi:GT2 family glycosyltransferase
MSAAAPVTAVIVCSFEDPAVLQRTIGSLRAQTRPPAEILVIDNHPEGAPGSALEAAGEPVRVVRSGRNLGYPNACNLAAEHARERWMFFLNPDAHAEPDCLERLLDAAADGVAIAGAQVLLDDGVTVNAGDNPVHLSGLSWSGRYLEPREDGPPRDVAAVSGAACLIRTSAFRWLGGHCPSFFLYHDDVDIAWRARMAGWRVVFVPSAVIRHDYEFEKGARKWFCLEHNRLWYVLANYEVRTLLLLAPLLLAAEAAIALLAIRDGWAPQKLRAWAAIVRERGELRRWRAHVQARRRRPDAELLGALTARLDTPLVRAPLTTRAAPALEGYRRAVLALSRA